MLVLFPLPQLEAKANYAPGAVVSHPALQAFIGPTATTENGEACLFSKHLPNCPVYTTLLATHIPLGAQMAQLYQHTPTAACRSLEKLHSLPPTLPTFFWSVCPGLAMRELMTTSESLISHAHTHTQLDSAVSSLSKKFDKQ